MEPPKYIPGVAVDAFERQDYQMLWKLALPVALDGNSDTQTIVALLYRCGPGVNSDVFEAERWLSMAAERGNPVARNNLASL
jgi:TPR repeat protein